MNVNFNIIQKFKASVIVAEMELLNSNRQKLHGSAAGEPEHV